MSDVESILNRAVSTLYAKYSFVILFDENCAE